jgi:oxygen-dependent protoporphyrinogen oxidase
VSFPADCLFRSRPRRKDIPRGFTLAGGLQTIADILSRAAGHPYRTRPKRRERCGAPGVEFVVRADDRDYTARHLCAWRRRSHVAAQLLRAEFPELAERLAGIPTAMVETVGVALPKSRLSLPPLAGLIGRGEAVFFGCVARYRAGRLVFRGFTFHFRPGALDEEGKLSRESPTC